MKKVNAAYNLDMNSTIISIEQSKEYYLEHIRKQIIKGIPAGKSYSGISRVAGTSYLRISYDGALAEKINKNLKDIVSEVISLGFKAEYLGKKLCFSSESLLNSTLVNTMSIFDNAVDKKIVLRSIEELEDISIDGLFLFRLESLKRRWDEIVKVTGRNSIVSYDSNIKTEFLKYLISSIPTLVSVITVEVSLRGYTLYDGEKEIEKMRLFSEKPKEDEELLYNLVCLAPKKVLLKGDIELLSQEALALTESLFLTEKINFI